MRTGLLCLVRVFSELDDIDRSLTTPVHKRHNRRLWGSKSKKPKRRVEAASEYAASRYVCALKELVDQAVQGELSTEAYPSVLPMPTRCVYPFIGWCVGGLGRGQD